MLRSFVLLALLGATSLAWAEPAVDLVRVFKAERRLQLVAQGKIVREFRVALGGNPTGRKEEEGDQKTPEGSYILDYKKADSGYHRALHISYPDSADIAAARARKVSPGGAVMIHGQKNGWGWLSFATQRFDWTNGCIALADDDMETVWDMVREGTRIEINP